MWLGKGQSSTLIIYSLYEKITLLEMVITSHDKKTLNVGIRTKFYKVRSFCA